MNTKVTIVIATHKKYEMPKGNSYLPLHVGKYGKENIGYTGDDCGDNISVKNSSFCELTGLYWGWKNLKSDYIGLVHYRRHFSKKKRFSTKKIKDVLNDDDINHIIKNNDIIVPERRWYIIETLYSHYAHTHDKAHLDLVRELILQLYPDYIHYFDKVMNQRFGHMFNMFIMKKELVNEYCEWLFNLLFVLEKEINTENLNNFDLRLYGRVSELLFNVWLAKKLDSAAGDIKIKSVPYMYTEKINLYKKIRSFIFAKYGNKKYTGSF